MFVFGQLISGDNRKLFPTNWFLWLEGFTNRGFAYALEHVTNASELFLAQVSPCEVLIGTLCVFPGSIREQRQNLPSLFIPICMHFFKRHAWHWFRCALSTTHRPVPAWHLKGGIEMSMDQLFYFIGHEKRFHQFSLSDFFTPLLPSTPFSISTPNRHTPHPVPECKLIPLSLFVTSEWGLWGWEMVCASPTQKKSKGISSNWAFILSSFIHGDQFLLLLPAMSYRCLLIRYST